MEIEGLSVNITRFDTSLVGAGPAPTNVVGLCCGVEQWLAR